MPPQATGFRKTLELATKEMKFIERERLGKYISNVI